MRILCVSSSACHRLVLSYFFHYEILDLPIVNNILILLCAKATEKVYQGLALEFWCKMLPETISKFFNPKKAAFVNVEVFDCAPDSCHSKLVCCYDGSYVVLINLLQAL